MKRNLREQERWERVRARLMTEAPYFGHIAATLTLAASEDLPTFQSRGETLRYNPSWLAELEEGEMMAVLANAAMHRVLWHENRGEGRQRRLWELATDYAVNALLAENGFELPLLARYDARYRGMYAEEIYAELLESMETEESEAEENEAERPYDEAPTSREDRFPAWQQTGEKRESLSAEESTTEALDRAFLEQIFARMEREGALPEGLERLVPRYFAHRLDWRQRLWRYLDAMLKSSYSFAPPNLKHLYRGIALPRLDSETLRIAVAIDSSGSVDEESLGRFLAELEEILLHFPDYRIDLLVADSKIRLHRELAPGERLGSTLVGGGHTDFRPVFDYIERRLEPPKLLIYFTDAQGTFPERAPLYEVLWVLNREGEVPFGEKIFLEG